VPLRVRAAAAKRAHAKRDRSRVTMNNFGIIHWHAGVRQLQSGEKAVSDTTLGRACANQLNSTVTLPVGWTRTTPISFPEADGAA